MTVVLVTGDHWFRKFSANAELGKTLKSFIN